MKHSRLLLVAAGLFITCGPGHIIKAAEANPYYQGMMVRSGTYNSYDAQPHIQRNLYNIQARLLTLGYYVGPEGANGRENAYTRAAIREFQRDQGLKASGIVDRPTSQALNRKSYTHYRRYMPTGNRFTAPQTVR